MGTFVPRMHVRFEFQIGHAKSNGRGYMYKSLLSGETK